jgi:hypothetical protein
MSTDGGAATNDRSGGIPAGELDQDDLLRELEQLHTTRHDTLRHGSPDALDAHTSRMAELEQEYLRRFPQREVDPGRLRSGSRERNDQSP